MTSKALATRPSLVLAPYAATIGLPQLATTRLGERSDSHDQEKPIPFALATLERASGVELFIVEGVDAAIDWNNIQPHPRLAELAARCTCGSELGDHEPGRLYADCEGFTPAGAT